MFRKWIIAAALAAATASLAPATADAAPFRVLRWAGTGFCQVWDYGFSYPWGLYDVMSRPKMTFNAAMHKRNWLVSKGYCTF